jgi:hypothetical protein
VANNNPINANKTINQLPMIIEGIAKSIKTKETKTLLENFF